MSPRYAVINLMKPTDFHAGLLTSYCASNIDNQVLALWVVNMSQFIKRSVDIKCRLECNCHCLVMLFYWHLSQEVYPCFRYPAVQWPHWNCRQNRLIDWLIGWLVGWLVDWSIDRSIDWLHDRGDNSGINKLIDLLIYLLIDYTTPPRQYWDI